MKEISVPVTIYKTKYETKDGKQFDNKDKALLHESKLNGSAKDCPHCNGKGYLEMKWC